MEVNEDLLTTFNIGVVVRGSVSETGHKGHDDQRYGVPRSKDMFRQGPATAASHPAPQCRQSGACNEYRNLESSATSRRFLLDGVSPGHQLVLRNQHSDPQEGWPDAGRQLESPSDMETATIVKRIVANRKAYEDRNAKKVASEAAYYAKQKAYMAEG